jgi:hypothetical protein
MREFLKGLELDNETIDTIMAEHGKIVTKDKEELQTLKSQISELKQNSVDGADWKEKFEKLDAQMKDQEAKRKAQEEDEILTNNILEVLGDKKFVNDYTKNSIVSEIKTALQDKANAGKSAKDLFENLTKDKTDIFVNENQIKDMPDVKNVDNKQETSNGEGIKLNPLFKNYN